MKKLLLCALGSLLSLAAVRAVDTTTVFNEIMYHPAGPADPEWIELYNQMAVNMDLSGWKITGGVNFTFPNGTTIPARGYLVVASDPGALQASTGITGVLGPWVGALNNSSETIQLKNRIGREMDRFHYEDSGQFPVAPDGGGVSLVKRQPGLASSNTESWTSSPRVLGTPSEPNFTNEQALSSGTTLSAYDAPWTFNQTGVNLGAAWAQTIICRGPMAGNPGRACLPLKMTPWRCRSGPRWRVRERRSPRTISSARFPSAAMPRRPCCNFRP